MKKKFDSVTKTSKDSKSKRGAEGKLTKWNIRKEKTARRQWCRIFKSQLYWMKYYPRGPTFTLHFEWTQLFVTKSYIDRVVVYIPAKINASAENSDRNFPGNSPALHCSHAKKWRISLNSSVAVGNVGKTLAHQGRRKCLMTIWITREFDFSDYFPLHLPYWLWLFVALSCDLAVTVHSPLKWTKQ